MRHGRPAGGTPRGGAPVARVVAVVQLGIGLELRDRGVASAYPYNRHSLCTKMTLTLLPKFAQDSFIHVYMCVYVCRYHTYLQYYYCNIPRLYILSFGIQKMSCIARK